MPSLKPLALCLLSASFLPGLAIAETDEAIPRPSPAGQIEAPPAIFDQAALVQITATVLAVDTANRLVTLEGPKGQSATIKAGPELRNFAQIAPGDKVTVDPKKGSRLLPYLRQDNEIMAKGGAYEPVDLSPSG